MKIDEEKQLRDEINDLEERRQEIEERRSQDPYLPYGVTQMELEGE